MLAGVILTTSSVKCGLVYILSMSLGESFVVVVFFNKRTIDLTRKLQNALFLPSVCGSHYM